MKATIVCDNENTMKMIDYIIRMGICNSRDDEITKCGIEYDGSKIDIVYSLEVLPEVKVEVKVADSTEKKKSEDNPCLYGARDTVTGKLVSDITNPKRKYWDREGNARKAIEYYNKSYACKNASEFRYRVNKGYHNILELVKFELVEVPTDGC